MVDSTIGFLQIKHGFLLLELLVGFNSLLGEADVTEHEYVHNVGGLNIGLQRELHTSRYRRPLMSRTSHLFAGTRSGIFTNFTLNRFLLVQWPMGIYGICH